VTKLPIDKLLAYMYMLLQIQRMAFAFSCEGQKFHFYNLLLDVLYGNE